MKKLRYFALGFLSALALIWAPQAEATITITVMGTGGDATSETTFRLPTTADAPAGGTNVITFMWLNGASAVSTVTDTAGNTYTTPTRLANGASFLAIAYLINTLNDLPAPCNVTATMTVADTLAISSASGGSACPNNDTLTAGMAVTGSSITALTYIASNCTLVSGAANCTLTGDVGTFSSGETVTLASQVIFNFTASTQYKEFVFHQVSGLGVGAVDTAGTGNYVALNTANSITTPATGSFNCATDAVFGWIGINTSPGTFTPSSSPWGTNTSSSVSVAFIDDQTQVTSSTAAQTYAPSWITARNSYSNIYAFEPASCVGIGGAGSGLMMGIP